MILLLCVALDIQVRSDFPGGSAKVERVDAAAHAIRLSPAVHADRGWACWWYFKVEGIEPGAIVTVDVGGDAFALPDRAMFSLDDARWTHTAPGKREKGRAVYTQKIDAREAWFAWGPPYLHRHAAEAVKRAGGGMGSLCKSAEGRAVPAIFVAPPRASDERPFRIWINARQHAWESGASWVCQGLIDWIVSDDPRAKTLRPAADLWIVPIMDVDNVERGAGGKNQKPHDHNRDWGDDAVWPEVREAMKQIRGMNDSKGGFDLYIDLHNPGPADRAPFFFVAPKEMLSERGRKNLARFLAAAKEEIAGPLKYEGTTRESGENYDPKRWMHISKNWVTKNTQDHVVAVTLETAWNTPNSTVDNYRRVGRELGLAIERYFRESPR